MIGGKGLDKKYKIAYMKSLKNRLLNEGFYQNAGGIAHPVTKADLEHEIKIRLDRGQTNLNDIDVSKVTDMSFLFTGYKDD